MFSCRLGPGPLVPRGSPPDCPLAPLAGREAKEDRVGKAAKGDCPEVAIRISKRCTLIDDRPCARTTTARPLITNDPLMIYADLPLEFGKPVILIRRIREKLFEHCEVPHDKSIENFLDNRK